MISAIIIDDEEKARKSLNSLIQEYCPQVEVAAMEGTVKGGLNAISKHNPDLLFLDIRMQGETSFDLLEQLEEKDFDIIFITAFNEYALKAFKFNAIDYLLKPVNIDELVDAVKKVEEKPHHFSGDRLGNFIESLKNQSNFDKIALPTMEGLNFVQLDNVIRCESKENYTDFHLANGEKILVSRTIKYFDDLLSECGFFRVHRSHLINLRHIQKYFKGEGGYCVMSDGNQVMVSRRKKEEFLSRFAGA